MKTLDERGRIWSDRGGFAEGDQVTRDGSDVHIAEDMDDDGYCATFRCVVAPASGWCAVGDREFNLCRRYQKVATPAPLPYPCG